MDYLIFFKKGITSSANQGVPEVMSNMRMMNNAETKSEWNRIKIMVKARFSELSDESIDSLRGNLDKLSARLQSTYGYPKEQADKELAGVKASLL